MRLAGNHREILNEAIIGISLQKIFSVSFFFSCPAKRKRITLSREQRNYFSIKGQFGKEITGFAYFENIHCVFFQPDLWREQLYFKKFDEFLVKRFFFSFAT